VSKIMTVWKREWLWWVIFVLAGWVIWRDAGRHSGELRKGLGFSLLPLLPALLMLWWMDRLPPLAARYWIRAVGWGLLVGPVVASKMHLVAMVVVGDKIAESGEFDPSLESTFAELASSLLSAPVWEESLKAILPVMFLVRSSSGRGGATALAGPWPALLFGSLVALSFGFIENATHYARNVSDWEGRRLFAYLHVLFALPLLLAVGYAAFLPTLSRRLALILLGWILSVALHGLWNWEARLGATSYSVAPWIKQAVILSPFICVAVWVAVYLDDSRRLRREGMGPIPLARPFPTSRSESVAASREQMLRHALEEDPLLTKLPQSAEVSVTEAG